MNEKINFGDISPIFKNYDEKPANFRSETTGGLVILSLCSGYAFGVCSSLHLCSSQDPDHQVVAPAHRTRKKKKKLPSSQVIHNALPKCWNRMPKSWIVWVPLASLALFLTTQAGFRTCIFQWMPDAPRCAYLFTGYPPVITGCLPRATGVVPAHANRSYRRFLLNRRSFKKIQEQHQNLIASIIISPRN